MSRRSRGQGPRPRGHSVYPAIYHLTMMTLSKTMVRSKLEYCCPVWSPASAHHIQRWRTSSETSRRRSQAGLLGTPEEAGTPITAKKTGTILYYPRLENAERTSSKQHQHGVRRAQPTWDPDLSTHREQQGPDLSRNRQTQASRPWNLLPKSINTVTSVPSLEVFKVVLGDYLRKITPPDLATPL